MKILAALASICALAVSSLAALSPLIVKEQEFVVQDSGDRFMIVGVDYQPGGQGAYGTGMGDPLSNNDACLRDAALMQGLGVNTIRVYNVDPTLDHSYCASIFDYVGIYMIIDVNSPLEGQSLNRANPESSYTSDYLSHIFSVVESFKDFPNLAGVFAGNEIINDVGTSQANPPFIRAVQRDLKNYIAAHASRQIPVGYSAAQVQEVLHDSWSYLQCNNSDSGPDMSRSDFFGLNSYSWCGSASSFDISGYDTLVEWFGNTTIPVFFSEYGCIDPLPRLFEEVPVLYGPQMTTLSGGLVYEFTQEVSNFGLTNPFANGSTQLRNDFVTLQNQYNKLNITLLTTQNSTATNLQPPRCNADLISSTEFSTDFNIPDPPPGADDLIANGVSNPPTGSLVSVTQTAVTVSVYGTDGAAITGLSLRAVSSANGPGGSTVGSAPTGSASGSEGSSSSTGLATKPTPVSYGGSAIAAAVFGAAVIVL